MLAGQGDGVRGKIKIERRLVLEATSDFNRAVADARGGGIAREQIAEHVSGFVEAHGTCAAEKLFDLVSVDGSRHGERHVSWRYHHCEGFSSPRHVRRPSARCRVRPPGGCRPLADENDAYVFIR